MKSVELFAGIGGFRVAADRLGWETDWANDNCPKACAVYRDRFGSTGFHEGDFAKLTNSVPDHDVLTGGFPCQPFSSAGKKKGTRDVRGTLFQLVVDVLKVRRPKYFILENVKRLLTMESGNHFATILGALAELEYAIEWRLLNATHFGLPQNRERVVIVGERVPSPTPRLAHVRLAECADVAMRDRSGSHPSCWQDISGNRRAFPTWGVATCGQFFGADLGTFAARQAPVTLSAVLEPRVPPAFDFTEATRKWVGDNAPVNRFVHGVEILSNQRGGARMGYTIFGTRGVAPTLTSTTSRHYERYKIGERYRRLTNVEYARIQGFPDDHCRAVSVYDQYALYGNAVPPPLAEWVLRQLTADGIDWRDVPIAPDPPTLFDDVH